MPAPSLEEPLSEHPSKLPLGHRDLGSFKDWGSVGWGYPDLLDALVPQFTAMVPCTEFVCSQTQALPGVGARWGLAGARGGKVSPVPRGTAPVTLDATGRHSTGVGGGNAGARG